MNNQQEKEVIIVDENDVEIGFVPRSEHAKHFYRVFALWITNSKGETYLSNILKETEEEVEQSLEAFLSNMMDYINNFENSKIEVKNI